ncbi:hypothetical protein ACJRO7_004844 [Eucalyptus globulus]|uniref:Uncharacterized protein n=1 Tax=Eucalyptus globulus TaxID=34317 RepID=A0ABD3J008_EUCGL
MPPLPPTSLRTKGQSSSNPNVDPEKLKRMLANRQYAQTYRYKQTWRMMQLEWIVQSLEADIQWDSTMMCYLARQHYSLQVENGILKQKLGFIYHEIGFKKAEHVQLKKEEDGLKKVFAEQQNYEELRKSSMASAQFVDMDQPGRPTYNFI